MQQTYKVELNSGEKMPGRYLFLCSLLHVWWDDCQTVKVGPRCKNLSKQLCTEVRPCALTAKPHAYSESLPYALPRRSSPEPTELTTKVQTQFDQKPKFEGQLQWRAAKIIALGGIGTRSQQRLCLKMYLVVPSDQINEAVGFSQTGCQQHSEVHLKCDVCVSKFSRQVQC